MGERFFYVGLIFIILGIFLIVLYSFINIFTFSTDKFHNKEKRVESKVFVGGFIGFIPFGFSNDKNLFLAGLLIVINFLLIVFLFFIFHII